jgi:hypothetical protein
LPDSTGLRDGQVASLQGPVRTPTITSPFNQGAEEEQMRMNFLGNGALPFSSCFLFQRWMSVNHFTKAHSTGARGE